MINLEDENPSKKTVYGCTAHVLHSYQRKDSYQFQLFCVFQLFCCQNVKKTHRFANCLK